MYIKLKRILLLVLVMVMFCNVNTYVVSAKESEEYKTFSQGDKRWKDHTCPGGYTIGSAGCFITSCAIILAYGNKDLRDVGKFNPQICGDKMSYIGGGLDAASIKNIDSNMQLVATDWKVDSNTQQTFSAKDAKEKVMGYLNKGYFVIIETGKQPITSSTHFSPIVGIENGTPVVWDVNGGKHSDWKTWAEDAGICRMSVFKHNKVKSLDVLQGGTGKDADSSKKASDKAVKVANSTMVAESQLVGMPVTSSLTENQIDLVLPDRSNLSIKEVNNMELIGQSIVDNKITGSKLLGVFGSFLGICLIMYAFMMFIALIFDVSNNFVEISLVSIMTLGHSKLILDDTIDKRKLRRGELTKKMWGLRAIIVLIVGMLLLSGVLRYAIAWVMNIVLGGI